MRITAVGGTDGASIVLFWPDSLPEDADELLADDPVGLTDTLEAAGQLVWFPCDGDGEYSLAVYLGEELPSELAAVCIEAEQIPSLHVSGLGYFGGMEYMFKHDSSLLARYPHMCQPIEIPSGTYSAVVYKTDISDSLHLSWLSDRVGWRAVRGWRLHKAVVASSAAAIIIGLFAFAVSRPAALGLLAKPWCSGSSHTVPREASGTATSTLPAASSERRTLRTCSS